MAQGFTRHLSGGQNVIISPTINWGADFGESSDDNTFTTGVNVVVPALVIENDKQVGVTVTMPELTTNFNTQTTGVHLSGSVLGAPFWQSVSETSTTAIGATNIVVTPPTGIQDGDLLLAFVGVSDVLANPVPVINLPASWTSIIIKTNIGAAFRYEVRAMYKIASSESGNYTFNWSTGALSYATAQIHRINGIDSVTPINISASNSGILGLGNPSNPPAPQVTTTVDNTLIFAYLYHDHLALSNAHTPPAGHDERVDREANVLATFQAQDSNTKIYGGAAGIKTAVTIVCSEAANTDWITLRVAVAPGILTIAT